MHVSSDVRHLTRTASRHAFSVAKELQEVHWTQKAEKFKCIRKKNYSTRLIKTCFFSHHHQLTQFLPLVKTKAVGEWSMIQRNQIWDLKVYQKLSSCEQKTFIFNGTFYTMFCGCSRKSFDAVNHLVRRMFR